MQRLEEFQTYTFKILKTIGEKNLSYYVLEDPFGIRHLLEAKYYPNGKYHFEIGTEIICRVDKINCKGQIFLEPRHPKFEIGQEVEFILKSTEESTETDIYAAEDSDRQTWDAVFDNENHSQFPLSSLFVIEMIKKGRIYLRRKD